MIVPGPRGGHALDLSEGDLERARIHLRAMRRGVSRTEPPRVPLPTWARQLYPDPDAPGYLAAELAGWRRLEWERANPPPPELPSVARVEPYAGPDGWVDPNVELYNAPGSTWPYATADTLADDWREREARHKLEGREDARERARALVHTLGTSRHWERESRAIERLRNADGIKVRLGQAVMEATVTVARDGSTRSMADARWLERQAFALTGCRDVRAFRDAACGVYTAKPLSCDVRVCPDCERARSARLVARMDGLTLDMARPVFWTFTVPNVPRGGLALGVDWVLDSFRALRRRAIIRGGRCRDDGAVHPGAAGGVYSIEVTQGRDGASWHPHVHALMDAPWIRWGELRDSWRAVTCDSIRKLERRRSQVNVTSDSVRRENGELRRPPRAPRLPRCEHRADERGIATGGCRGASIVWVSTVAGDPGSPERRAALHEVLKYAVGGLVKDGKLADSIGPGDLGELLLALRNRRLVSGWGGWRNVHDEDEDDEAPAEGYVLVETGEDRNGVPIRTRMPARCPHCHSPALWEPPVRVPRRECIPRDGSLMWRPPRAGPTA